MKAQNVPVTLLALLAIGVMTSFQSVSAQEQELGKGATIGVVATATVKAIDADTRTVTLETADGGIRTINCGKEAVNVDKVKVGDQVKAVALERLAVTFGKGAAPSASDGLSIFRAPKGARPGLIIANTEDVAVKIDSVDMANRTITVQGPDGTKQ